MKSVLQQQVLRVLAKASKPNHQTKRRSLRANQKQSRRPAGEEVKRISTSFLLSFAAAALDAHGFASAGAN